MVLLQCFNKGCGRKFDPDDSSDVCVYHPANPFFHDAYKGWQCCNKKVTDFTEFLNIKGCATGRHNPEKPEANEQSLSNSKAVDCEKVEIPAPIVKRLPAERPKGIVEFRMLNISLSPSVEASLRNAQKPVLNKTCLQDDISSVAAGTVCKNAGCQYAFDGSSDHVQGECFYHSGLPIFHEGMKYWTCCQKKTSEFENFLNQPGCTKGVHKFSQEKKPVTCRYDWHQTAQFVTVAFYTKNVALDQSYIETNPFALKVHIDLDNEQESNVFDLLIPLWDEIDPLCSKATLYTTKLEVSLKKIEPTHWTSLESKNDTYSKISG